VATVGSVGVEGGEERKELVLRDSGEWIIWKKPSNLVDLETNFFPKNSMIMMSNDSSVGTR
jgi:hypothetical protein